MNNFNLMRVFSASKTVFPKFTLDEELCTKFLAQNECKLLIFRIQNLFFIMLTYLCPIKLLRVCNVACYFAMNI